MVKGAICLLIAGVYAVQEPPSNPIRWSAQTSTERVKAGDVVTVEATAVMDDGWHLYALDAVEGGPIPTRITAGPQPAFTLRSEEIEKPEPKRAQDPNFGVETAYYEGSATFGLPIRVSKDVLASEREIEITARFQACNDRFCLRPQTAIMKVKARVQR